MDPIEMLLDMPEIDLEAIFDSMPDKVDSGCQTDPEVLDLESLVPLGRAIQLGNLLGMCVNDKKEYKGQVNNLLKLIDKSPALKDFKPIVKEILDYSKLELAQLLYFSNCIYSFRD